MFNKKENPAVEHKLFGDKYIFSGVSPDEAKERDFRKAVNDMALTFYWGIHNSSGVDKDDVEESIGKFVRLAADYLGIERVDFNPSEAYKQEQEKSDPDNPPRTDEDAYYD